MRLSIDKWSAMSALAAGLLYIVQALIGLMSPQTEVFTTPSDYILEAVFVAALLLTLPALLGLHDSLGGHAARLGTAGFYAASAGTTLILASASATLIGGSDALGLLFVVGLLGAVAGNMLLGIAIIRTKALPLWCSTALMLGLPASMLLVSLGGGIVLGCAWIALGYALGKERQALRERGSRTNRDKIGTRA